jgi:hypothetical protein
MSGNDAHSKRSEREQMLRTPYGALQEGRSSIGDAPRSWMGGHHD